MDQWTGTLWFGKKYIKKELPDAHERKETDISDEIDFYLNMMIHFSIKVWRFHWVKISHQHRPLVIEHKLKQQLCMSLRMPYAEDQGGVSQPFIYSCRLARGPCWDDDEICPTGTFWGYQIQPSDPIYSWLHGTCTKLTSLSVAKSSATHPCR